MPPPRLSRAQLADHLVLESAPVRRLVLALRACVLKAVPAAAEAFKFHTLCYYHADAWFGSIGGNICMIEIKKGKVLLSFIHGAGLADPDRLLFGKGNSKRFMCIPDAAFAARPQVRALIRAAAELRPWD